MKYAVGSRRKGLSRILVEALVILIVLASVVTVYFVYSRYSRPDSVNTISGEAFIVGDKLVLNLKNIGSKQIQSTVLVEIFDSHGNSILKEPLSTEVSIDFKKSSSVTIQLPSDKLNSPLVPGEFYNVFVKISNLDSGSNKIVPVRAYCLSFSGGGGVAGVETVGATDVSSTSATLIGRITGTETMTVRGFEWGTESGSYTDSWTEEGTFSPGTFSHQITGLDEGKTYYFRAKAYKPTLGWIYGDELSFSTPAPSPPNVFIWFKDNKLYSGLPPDNLHEIDETYLENLQQRRIDCCWYQHNMYWIVYFKPTVNAIYIKTSTDLKTWSSPKTVDTGCSSFEDSLLVGDYLYVVGIKNNNVYLYRVQLLSSGDISVTVMFNFGCTQYPNNPLERCDFSIRGNEMWFHYFVYINDFQTNVYRRVSYDPFNSVSSETYASSTMFMPDAIAMINGATHMFAFRQHHWRGTNYLYECHYDGTSWSTCGPYGYMNYIFPFNWNGVTYAFCVHFNDYMIYWTGRDWSYVDYTDVLTENNAYTAVFPVIWVESSNKLVGAIQQYDLSTSKYRIRYFEIDSSLHITLKQATDWFTDDILPYSVINRAVTL